MTPEDFFFYFSLWMLYISFQALAFSAIIPDSLIKKKYWTNLSYVFSVAAIASTVTKVIVHYVH